VVEDLAHCLNSNLLDPNLIMQQQARAAGCELLRVPVS
jgi:hypothetical protein